MSKCNWDACIGCTECAQVCDDLEAKYPECDEAYEGDMECAPSAREMAYYDQHCDYEDVEMPSTTKEGTEAPVEYGEMVEMDINYQSPDGDDLTGYCVYMNLPGDPERPGLLLFGGFWGDGGDESERDIAQDFAEMGFTVFVPDYFPGTHSTDSMDDLNDSFSQYGPFLADTVKAQGVAMAAYRQLMNAPNVDPSKISAIGFCFGGAMVLNLARAGADLVVAVSLHGEYPDRGAMTGTYDVKYFAEIVGSSDPIINDEARESWISELEEHTSASDEMSYEMIVWGNAYHGFAIQYSSTFYEFIAQAFETDVISDDEHGNIGAAGVMLWDEDRETMTRDRVMKMMMDCDVFETNPIQPVFTEMPGYYCSGNWDSDYVDMSFGATLDMCMTACYTYSMEGETCTGIVYGDIGEEDNSLCVICSTDTWETNWLAQHVLTGYKLGEDPCACEEGYGWSSESNTCEMGSTTNCSECPLMDDCDTSMCMDNGEENCPLSYDPMRMCQCTADCEEYGNCCDDASSCHDSGDEDEDEGEETEDESEVDCDDCVSRFMRAGGCECWKSDSCNQDDLVPEGCDPCGEQAAVSCGITGDEIYVCVGEISSMDARCSVLDNQEDCESEGANAISDGVCDWVMEEDDDVETTCTPMMCGCSPGFNTVETTDGNGCVTECTCVPQTCVANLIATNMKCNSDTKFRNAIRGMDSAQMCVDENEEVGTVYNYMSVREGGCVLETTCEESDRVATNLDWQIYEVVCS